jgi:two-component system, chemotaxis family, response regulator PixG
MTITSQSNVKFQDLIAEFNHIKAEGFSGNLIIQVTDTPSWMLYFAAGLLAGISGGIDAIDRWKRNLALASLNVPLDQLIKSTYVKISVPSDHLQNRTIPKSIPLIACIDDSLSVYMTMEKIITEYGYRCFGIQDPLRIITGLLKNKPDLIFLDLVMPVTNGYEVCEQIRKTPSLANIPIVILTGNDGLIDRVRTKFVGANGFLGKPIQVAAVTKMIDKYLEEKQLNRNVTIDQTDLISSVENSSITQHRQAVLHSIGKQVLVVDDDRNIREVVSMCLHKLKGWDVLTAASGQEGLNGIQLKNPDVIILDVMMPEMDGLAFLRRLRSNPDTKQIPVILLTANRYLPDKALLTELGVVETISKPFLPVNLVRQIDKALLN